MSFHLFRSVLVAGVCVASVVTSFAQGLSYNVGVVSLYKFNGVDQGTRSVKNVRPALQGGIDYRWANGFYVGNWNSSGTFLKADLELDLYAGYAGQLDKSWAYDLGLIRYVYPQVGEKGWNTNEVYASLAYQQLSFKVTQGVSDSNKDFVRYALTFTQPINANLSASLTLADRNRRNGGYSDFALGADYTLAQGRSLSLNLSGAGKTVEGFKPDAHKTRLVLGLKQTF